MGTSYDLVTVGGGLGGATLARQMAAGGARVLVVERERHFGDRVRGEVLQPWGVGEARALGLALTGDKLSAEQAAEWGLIWQCVDDGQLPVVIDKLLAQLAQGPTRGLGAIKRAIQASASNTLASQLDLERDVQRELGFSDDYREGVAAFTAKRPPKFTGR